MSSKLPAELQHFADLDARLVAVAKSIKILTSLNWPVEASDEFLKGWKEGKPRLPSIIHRRPGHSAAAGELDRIAADSDRSHPVGRYIARTAESYATAARMLDASGTPEFTECSIRLYGQPSETLSPQGLSHAQAADHFIETTRDFIQAYYVPNQDYCLSSEEVARELRERLVPYFAAHKVEVVLDPALTAKAVAGSQRIRLRDQTCFSAFDVQQLLHHEGFVHMLSAINGRNQPNLPSLGLGSPRTTRTQEGLATFAELITSSIDLARLRRIALRIHGVKMGLEGADFIEVFRYFLDSGQDEKESFQSTARVFRGGDPRGTIVFTKDVVYLQGLIYTHTFLRKAVQASKYQYAEHLFAGRMTLGDIVDLEPFLESGFIVPPVYEPPWLVNRHSLAAYLCYAVFANRINLGEFTLEDFSTRQI